MKQTTRDRLKYWYSKKQQIIFDFRNGYAEISDPINLVRDMAIISTPLILLGFRPTFWGYGVVAITSFLLIWRFGVFLRKNGVIKYGNWISNQQNEAMLKIEEIHKAVKEK